jgi:hypothetical protein
VDDVDTLLQVVAVLLRRLGGETIISQREFEMVEGLPVFGNSLLPEHLRLYLVERPEICDGCGDIYLNGETPPEPLE